MRKILCQSDPDLDQPVHANVKQTAINVFNSNNIVDCDISFIFVSDDFLSDFKKKYFHKNHFTDVIAFRLNEYEESFVEGEVYISLPRAKENARFFNQPYAKEVSRLIIHGCLHLIGFKDDSKTDKEIMIKNEDEILKITNWKDIFTS